MKVNKASNIIKFGLLGFTLLILSGGKPKKEGMVKTLAMSLGPDFMTDIVIVETSDHARLSL